MARNNQYPIILGMNPPNKQGIGIKSKLGSGYDLYILDEDMTHQYAQLHQRRRAGSLDFCKLWEECPIQRRILISSIELRQNI